MSKNPSSKTSSANIDTAQNERSSGHGFIVVGVGASSGGLEAVRKLITPLPPRCGMALILVQHLDRSQDNILAELLATHTALKVVQAAHGMIVQPDHLYVIPAGSDLSVSNGGLRLTKAPRQPAPHMPVDHLLTSLAQSYAARSVAVILSGSGADGSKGAEAVKAAGGLVIVQDPDDAGYGAMPRSVIDAGAADAVYPATGIGRVLLNQRMKMAGRAARPADHDLEPAWLAETLTLLRDYTPHDFRCYKTGTLRRRIERRMGMVESRGMDQYLAILRSDPDEVAVLAKDLLINVTNFFRDPQVFEALSVEIIPQMVRSQARGGSLRIWVAGCSTGEEAYSLAMLFCEAITAAKLNIKLQMFASDVDADALAVAREGVYPHSIASEVSPERLERFFSREEGGYRVSSELRSSVVFAIQDVLGDPPFSRINFISCRNLLIYLRPEAQHRVMSLFHFSLRENGLLLLGNTETTGQVDDHFEVISKTSRLYRRAGGKRATEFPAMAAAGTAVRAAPRAAIVGVRPREEVLVELFQQTLMNDYAPTAVLINAKHECLYSVGPTGRYLTLAPGLPSHNLLEMAPLDIRSRLRTAIRTAGVEQHRVNISGGKIGKGDAAHVIDISIHPVSHGGEALYLVSFIDRPLSEHSAGPPADSHTVSPTEAVQAELQATRAELDIALSNLDLWGEEQRTINDEARSVAEEYQSTNEELLTSKEELQSLNEELTALNGQLQETLERQRTTANDLQNVLYSTDVPTLFIDTGLNIRFFTPATRALFNLIPGDVGRPLTDLTSLTADKTLSAEARQVLDTLEPIEREIEAPGGGWYQRRILPYRTHDNQVEGVVITFIDVTERRKAATGWEEARQQAEMANTTKSRFLAAASHDLRQPLQTLGLLHGLLAKSAESDRAQGLIDRFGDTLGAMGGMLNVLLDINQLEAGAVQVEMINFPLNSLLTRLSEEFSYLAQAQGIDLTVVACNHTVHGDPRLLEQMIRNLLSNAFKYAPNGKVVLGCRRHEEHLSIELFDNGIGIPASELGNIFEQYHQLGNPARERARGLGLGLAIVQRLGNLLQYRMRVRSTPGAGSVFAIDGIPVISRTKQADHASTDGAIGPAPQRAPWPGGLILVVEDDPDVRGLLELALLEEGHQVRTASDSATALAVVADPSVQPDLVLADFNLPGDLDGLQLLGRLRERLKRPVPGIMLTGDISTATSRQIAAQRYVQFNKPVKTLELLKTIQRLMPVSDAPAIPVPSPPVATSSGAPARRSSSLVFVVDDDTGVRAGLRSVLEDGGLTVEDFADAEAFLRAYRPGRGGCILIDAVLPGMSGIALLQHLAGSGDRMPAIVITGRSDVSMAVEAMKAGASDFIEKPISGAELLASIGRVTMRTQTPTAAPAWAGAPIASLGKLTSRQRQIMDMVLAGHASKIIAADLGISQRTVENHRAAIMKRSGAKSLPALARMALAAGWGEAAGQD